MPPATPPAGMPRCNWCQTPVLEPRGWNGRDALYCKEHEVMRGRDPLTVARTAIFDAMDLQEKDADSLIRWPFRQIDEMAGALVPRRLYYVAAFPGNGKTSWLSACYAKWVADGFRVTYLPLESDPMETVTRVACARAGVNPDDALSLRLKIAADAGQSRAMQQRADLMVAFRLLLEDKELWDLFQIEPTMTLTPKKLQEIAHVLRHMESDILLVDHIDNSEADENVAQSEIAVSNKLQTLGLEIARKLDIPVVFATQLNSTKTHGDRLAHYRPPIMDWLYNKGKKEQLAAVCLGLFRPLRADIEEDLMDAAKKGLSSPSLVAKPNTMAVNLMKGRYSGSMKDAVAELHYSRGRLSDDPLDFLEAA
jgi:KaiC/GvpD/RAD55 family RecA-like ATPase